MSYSLIDVGTSAIDRAVTTGTNTTRLVVANPSNLTGKITSVEIYLATAVTNNSLKVGSFYGSGTSWTCRDYSTIGNCSSGSKQTLNVDFDIVTSDILGVFFSSGTMESDNSGSGYLYLTGDNFSGTKTYALYGNSTLSLYATGFTVPDAPTNVAATENSTTKVTITWTKVTGQNVTDYRVFRDATDLGLAGDVATFDDTGGTAGTTYAYTVKAINAAGESSASTADNGIKVTVSEITKRVFLSYIYGWPNNTMLDDRWYLTDTYYFSNGVPPVAQSTMSRRGMTTRTGSRL